MKQYRPNLIIQRLIQKIIVPTQNLQRALRVSEIISIVIRLLPATDKNMCCLVSPQAITVLNTVKELIIADGFSLQITLTKSYLKLRTKCHSTSYNAITSHMVVAAIRYMILAVERFRNNGNRSIKDLFYGIQREIVNELMDCAIVLMIDTLLDSIRDYYNATEIF